MSLHDSARPTRDDSSVELLEVQHADVRSLLSAAADGPLSATEASRVAGHLQSCDGCRAYARTLERVTILLGQLPAHELPADARRRLYERLDASEG